MSEVTRIKEEIKGIEKLIKEFNEYPNGNGFNDKTRNQIIKVLEEKKKSLKFTYKMINPKPVIK